jgi:glucose dehydrogenase
MNSLLHRRVGPRPGALSALLALAVLPAMASAQTMSPPVPAGEVFTAAQIGRALSPPTPNAGKTAPSLANAPVDDGQWTMPAKNYAATRYSAQTEITAANVGTLKPAFTFPLGVAKGQEAAPIVADGMMYVVTAYPNLVYAFDLKKGDGKPVWTYTPDTLPAAQGVACCDVVNRGGTVSKGRYIFNTLDNQTISLDAKTGKVVWKVRLGDINKGETMTMAPLVAKGKVYVGNSGGEMGVRGWMIALDEATGKQVWKAFGTGPDRTC